MYKPSYQFFFLILAFALFVSGCVISSSQSMSPSKNLNVEKSLPQSKLAYYNDSFDKLREDLWDKAGWVPKNKLANFKLAETSIEDGKLIVKTKIGCFSKGGLGSKYSLRGDFDIQVDCDIDFLKGQYDMDQRVDFIIMDKSKDVREFDGAVLINVSKSAYSNNQIISSIYCESGECRRRNWRKIDNFHGSLRIIRKGNKIATLYKQKGAYEWKELSNLSSTTNDVILGFKLQNFKINRTSITAISSIIAIFDNFRINSAYEIIEEEI